MKIFKIISLLLLLTVVFSGCADYENNSLKQENTSSEQQAVLELHGKSDNWIVDYIITESDSDPKYKVQYFISPTNQTEAIYNVSYDVTSTSTTSTLSGSLSTDKDNSIFQNSKVSPISPTFSSHTLPPEDELITVTIKWNDANEETIQLKK